LFFDVATAHVLAMQKIEDNQKEYEVFNLGSGTGFSVKDVLKGFAKAMGEEVKHEMGPRRFGDVPKLVADSTKANLELGWKTTKTLDQMCEDSYKFIAKRIKK
jgi:UDP-glucose 4-epimerase